MTENSLFTAFLAAVQTVQDASPRAKFNLKDAWQAVQIAYANGVTVPDAGLPYVEAHVPCKTGRKFVHFTFWDHGNARWEPNAYAL